MPLKSGSKNSSRGGTRIYLLVSPEGDTEKPRHRADAGTG
jgi:hypothetical protein